MKKLGLLAGIVAICSVILLITGAVLAAPAVLDQNMNGGLWRHTEKNAAESIDGIEKIMLDFNAANVKVDTDDGDQIMVEMDCSTLTVNQSYAVSIKSTRTGNQLRITIDEPAFRFFQFQFYRNCRVSVTIPKTYTGALEGKFNAAKADLSGLSGISQITLIGNAATIEARDLTGNLSLNVNASNTKIFYQKVLGNLNARGNASTVSVTIPADPDIYVDAGDMNASSFRNDFGLSRHGGRLGDCTYEFRFSGGASTFHLRERE